MALSRCAAAAVALAGIGCAVDAGRFIGGTRPGAPDGGGPQDGNAPIAEASPEVGNDGEGHPSDASDGEVANSDGAGELDGDGATLDAGTDGILRDDAPDGGGILFSDNFDDGIPDGWTTYGGNWVVLGGQYQVTSVPGGPKSIASGTYTDFTYEADISINQATCVGQGNAGLIFRATAPAAGDDAYAGYYAGINPTNATLEFGRADMGTWTALAVLPLGVSGPAYHLTVAVLGPSIKIYVGPQMAIKLVDTVNSTYVGGGIGVRSHDCSAVYDNIVVHR